MRYVFLLGLSLCAVCSVAQVSEQDFWNPPRDARPNTYWEWMNGNITKEGLTADLEYMKRANYGAAMIFEAGVGIPRGPIDYNSGQWTDAIIHAMKEAERLGLQLFMHNSPGYSGTGGPWITPEYSMKQLVWTDDYIASDGKKTLDLLLARPFAKAGFYKDAYILAYPSLPDENVSFADVVKRVTLEGEDIQNGILLDNDLSTQCHLEGGQSILIELSSPFTARSGMVFRGDREKPLDPHDGPRDYAPVLKVEISDDGTDFRPVGQFSCVPLRAMDVPGTISFPSVTARFFKITSNRSTNIAELNFHSTQRVENYPAKINAGSGKVTLDDSKQSVQAGDIINPCSVVDLTDKVSKDGRLKWKAPKGRWTIVRIGYTTTGEHVAAAPDAGVGLDCDKMSKEGLDRHFDLFVDPLMSKLKPWCGTTLEALAVDSWEAGKQNWTDSLPEYFKNKRGYDIMPYMLAVTGRFVSSASDTERFLWDFRRTHTDMFMGNYIGHFKERIGRHGLKYAGEAYGDGNFESLELAASQDYPMSEFWTHYIYGNISTTMLASSAAHVWGRPIVSCECYTGTPFNSKFTEHPYGMKALGDYILTAGVNRFVYHATTHQPYTGAQPGNMMTMGPFGTHLDRTSTWASQFSDFNRYIGRCSYMLQQGQYVADVLYLKDEAISSGINNYNVSAPATPYGYRWDITDVQALQKRLSVKDGKIVLPDGISYSLMVVTPMKRTSPETLRRIIDLVEQGMTVMLMGDSPVGYPGLNEQKDREVKILADKLWNSDTLGKGHIIHGGEIGEVLATEGVLPDFSFAANNKDAQIHFIHRTVGGDDIYFVTNHRRRPEKITATFRVNGKVPRLWNAETGETDIRVPYEAADGVTRLNLDLHESGSVFVVFRNGEYRPTDIEVVHPESTPVKSNGRTFAFDRSHCFNSTFSISMWVKPETFAASGRGFVLYPATESGDKAQVGVTVGQNGVRVYERNRRNSTVLEYSGPVEGWTHLALVYDEGIPSLYLNGVKVAGGKKSNYDCYPAIDNSMAEEQYAASFEGDMAGLEVFDYVLTGDNVRNITRAGLPAPRYDGEVLKTLGGEWKVSFPAWSKIKNDIVLPQLESLHRHSDFDVKHFSGTAVYTKKLLLTEKDLNAAGNARLVLDLGRVENIAEVSVNGSDYVLAWKAPYVVDVTDMLRSGENEVRIKVTNLYANRFIGDEHLPEKYDYDEYGRIRRFPDWYMSGQDDERERVLFSPWKHYTKNDPLLESGLLGPVRLLKQ